MRTEFQKKYECVVNLIGAVPVYHTNNKDCNYNIVAGEGLGFNGIKCGIYFNYIHWNKPQIISVSGHSDEKVNIGPRIMYLRLYVDANKSSGKPMLNFWKGYLTHALKFIIHDSDNKTFDAPCSSNNDPHMTTFDQKSYDFHKTEGEYILYKHEKLPVEVHSYYQKCNYWSNGALCNCGAAVRSGDSIFIANFCRVGGRENKYAIQKICDEQDMRVTPETNKYTVQIMSGTKIVVSFGEVTRPGEDFYGIQTFQVLPSTLDRDLTSGLCGSLNGNSEDDLIARGEETPVKDPEYFAESWRLKSGEEDESLFNISNIKPAKRFHRPHCTCKKDAKDFPYGEPQFQCNKTELIECSKLRVKNRVYKFPCKNIKTKHLRTGRDVSRSLGDLEEGLLIRHRRDVSEFADDDAPVMYAMNITSGISNEVDLSWKNSWTEEKAQKHCSNALMNSPSFSVCQTNVQSVDSSNFINNCVADIRLTGESDWDGISVDSYGTTCLNVASKVEILTKTHETSVEGEEVSIFQLIQAATCPRNCSGNGECVEGQCVCNEPYFGAICDVEKTQAPKLSPRAFNGLCDISLKPCHKFMVPGLNFVDGNLTCRFKHFTIKMNETIYAGRIELVDGIYTTPFSMQCPAPSSRHKRSVFDDSSAFGYFMSVSNDGKNFTKDLIIIVYDSLCLDCNTENITCTEVDTCPKNTPSETTQSTPNITTQPTPSETTERKSSVIASTTGSDATQPTSGESTQSTSGETTQQTSQESTNSTSRDTTWIIFRERETTSRKTS